MYEATIRFGIKTETGDREGSIIESRNVNILNLTEEKIKEVLGKFIGKQMQRPPMYSAVKVKGKKLYEYARTGKSVDIPIREIEIYNIELLIIDKENLEIVINIFCSKGTYIRTLCENIAETLGEVRNYVEFKKVKGTVNLN